MTRDQMTILFGGTTLINRRVSDHIRQNLIRFSSFSVNAEYTPHFHTGLQGRLGFQGHGNLSAGGLLSVYVCQLNSPFLSRLTFQFIWVIPQL